MVFEKSLREYLDTYGESHYGTGEEKDNFLYQKNWRNQVMKVYWFLNYSGLAIKAIYAFLG
jgi:hypothetical protein